MKVLVRIVGLRAEIRFWVLSEYEAGVAPALPPRHIGAVTSQVCAPPDELRRVVKARILWAGGAAK
jgi:hypothetical protein